MPSDLRSKFNAANCSNMYLSDTAKRAIVEMDRSIVDLFGRAINRRLIILVLIVTLARGIALQADDATPTDPPEAADIKPAVASITVEELKKSVEFLASDTLQGREAGSQGNYAAGAFLIDKMKRHGLQPAGDDGDWYQYFRGSFRNILGKYEGADSLLKNELILICAHYDHVGYGTPKNSRGPIGYVHNGADDNASGCAALLEVMEALPLLKTKPKRSLLFVFWDGEEQGLLGSKHFVAESSMLLEQIRFVLNADMVGRLNDDGLQLQGWRTTVGFRQFATRANDGKLRLDFHLRYVADSDHWPFFERNIPSLMFHTGKHEDYHRPSDDADKVNFVGLRDASQFLLRLTVAAAMTDQLPTFRPQSKSELPAQNEVALRPRVEVAPRPVPGRLGVRFDSGLVDGRRLKLVGLEMDGSGAKAGLQIGDELIEFGGQPVKDWPDFRTLVLAAKSPAKVVLKRNGAETSVVVNLHGERHPIGLECREDDAEPKTAIVTQVIAGSVADHAGIRPGQRVVSIDGAPLEAPSKVVEQLLAAPLDARVTVEQDGQLRDLHLKRVAQ